MKYYITLFILLFTNIAPISADIMRDKILDSLHNFAKDHRIQASYEISVDSKTILTGAQGFANFEQNKRLSRNQAMPILSLTKQFTAAGILVLQERGSLNVNDKLSAYSKAFKSLWPNRELPEGFQNITIHNLLTHSSGLPDYIGALEVTEEKGRKIFENELGDLIIKKKSTVSPGSKYDYNNTNYYLLGLIIEEVSGLELGLFFKQEFFDILGMHNTYLLSFAEATHLQKVQDSEKFPIRYFAMPSETSPKFFPAPPVYLLAPGGDCGLVSTASDLVKWNEALHTGRILSKTSYKKMTKPYFKVVDKRSGYNAQMGYGTYISVLNNGMTFYHHTTAGHGIRCDAGYIPEKDMAIAIISNVLFQIPEDMASRIDFRKPENQIDITYLRNAMLESL